MSDDLVNLASLIERRQVNEPRRAAIVVRKAATALEEARAEIERLRASVTRLTANPADHRYWEGRWRDADRELSILRARVREVVGPFSRLDTSHTDDIDDSALVFENEGGDIVLGHLRAACQLMEEVK